MKVWLLARIDSKVLDDKDEMARCFPVVQNLGVQFAKDLMEVVGKGVVSITGFDSATDDPAELAKAIRKLVTEGEESK